MSKNHPLNGEEQTVYKRPPTVAGASRYDWVNRAEQDELLDSHGAARLTEGLDLLAMVIRTNADKLPFPWAVSENVPEHWTEVKDYIQRTGTIVVWSGGSEQTIYEDPKVNYQFRAWHDYFHFVLDQPFTTDGETVVAEAQVRVATAILKGAHARHRLIQLVSELIMCEITEQACGYFATGKFEDDQVAFTLKHLKWKGLV